MSTRITLIVCAVLLLAQLVLGLREQAKAESPNPVYAVKWMVPSEKNPFRYDQVSADYINQMHAKGYDYVDAWEYGGYMYGVFRLRR